jgi:hypothetical protein
MLVQALMSGLAWTVVLLGLFIGPPLVATALLIWLTGFAWLAVPASVIGCVVWAASAQRISTHLNCRAAP